MDKKFILIFISLFIFSTLFVEGALYKNTCWSLTNGVSCINGTSGQNILTGIKINQSDILNNLASGDGNNYTSGVSVDGNGVKTINIQRVGMSNLTASWTDLTGSGAVDSVNGHTGVVVLTSGDVGAYDGSNPSGFVNLATVQATGLSTFNNDVPFLSSVDLQPYLKNDTNIRVNRITANSSNMPLYSGVEVYVEPVSNTTGGVNLSSVVAYCFDDLKGNLSKKIIPSSNNTILVDGIDTANYVAIDCLNSVYVVTASKYDFVSTNGRFIPYATIIRSSNNLHIEGEVFTSPSGVNRLVQRTCDINEYAISEDSTISISVDADFNISHGAMQTYACMVKDDEPATSPTERGFFVFHNSSTMWTTLSKTPPQLNSTYFDNGTGLQRYQTGFYGICYYYVGIESGQHVYFRCSSEFATQDLAKASNQFPTVPKLISEHTIYLGRIIFQESNSSNVLIQYTGDVVGSATPVTNHNSLSGLQGGSSNNYWHLYQDISLFGFLNFTNFTYFDNKINSLNNLSINQISGSLGNWSFDKVNYYNKSETNSTIDSKLATIVYYPTSNLTVFGTWNGGNLTNLSFIDKTIYNVTEVGGANALEVRVNFSGVTQNFTNIQLYVRYVGSTTHEQSVDLWDYTTSSWENYYLLGTTTSYVLYNLPVADASEHINGGIVQLRFRQVQNGIAGHYLMIDEIQLQKGLSIIGQGQTHDPSKLDVVDQRYNDSLINTSINIQSLGFYNSTYSDSKYYQNNTDLIINKSIPIIKLIDNQIPTNSTYSTISQNSTTNTSILNINTNPFDSTTNTFTYFNKEIITTGTVGYRFYSGDGSASNLLLSINTQSGYMKTPFFSIGKTATLNGARLQINGSTNISDNLYVGVHNITSDLENLGLNITNVNATANLKALPGKCAQGQFVNETTNSGVICGAVTGGSGNVTSIGFNVTGTLTQLNLRNSDGTNVTATFTDQTGTGSFTYGDWFNQALNITSDVTHRNATFTGDVSIDGLTFYVNSSTNHIGFSKLPTDDEITLMGIIGGYNAVGNETVKIDTTNGIITTYNMIIASNYTVLPTCDSTKRMMFAGITNYTGTGEDVSFQCMMNSTAQYTWVIINRGG